MKSLLLICLSSLSLSSFGADIKGLDPHEKVDATKCLMKLHGVSYEQINKVPNDLAETFHNPSVEKILMHNFIHELVFDESKIENSAVISGSLLINGKKLSLKNTVVANATLAGDISNVDFSGACLINVSLPTDTSWLEYFKIRRSVGYFSNIEFDDNIYKYHGM